jgi:hypothetical protein
LGDDDVEANQTPVRWRRHMGLMRDLLRILGPSDWNDQQRCPCRQDIARGGGSPARARERELRQHVLVLEQDVPRCIDVSVEPDPARRSLKQGAPTEVLVDLATPRARLRRELFSTIYQESAHGCQLVSEERLELEVRLREYCPRGRAWNAALLLAAFLGLLTGSTASDSARYDVRVLLVHLHSSVDASGARIGAELDAFHLQHGREEGLSLQPRAARRQSVRSVLSGRVQGAQAAVKHFVQLNATGSVEILPLWIQNTLIVRISEQDDDSRACRLWRFFEQELRLINAEEEAATHQDECEGGDSEAQGNIKLLHAPEL